MNSTKKDERDGYIYVLRSHAHISDLYKIGRTQSTPKARAAELDNTSLPSPFEVVACTKVPDCVVAEKLLKVRLADHRWNPDREFFQLPLPQIEQEMHEVSNNVKFQKQSVYSELRESARKNEHLKKAIFVFPLLEYMVERGFNCRSNPHNKSLNFRIRGFMTNSHILIGAYLKSNGYIWVYAYAPKQDEALVKRLCQIAHTYRSEGRIQPEENWNRGKSLSVEEYLPYEDIANIDFGPIHETLVVYAEMAKEALDTSKSES